MQYPAYFFDLEGFRLRRSSAKNVPAFRVFPLRYSSLLLRIWALRPGSCISKSLPAHPR